MKPFDDYQDEMGRLSVEQIDAVLDGRRVDAPGAERLAAFARDLREGLLVELHPEIEARHLASMRAEAVRTARRIRPGRVTTRLALAAALLVGAGVAAAATARLGGPPAILPEDLPIPVEVVERVQPESEPAPAAREPADRPFRSDDGTSRGPSRRSKGCEAADRCERAAGKGKGEGRGKGGDDARGGPPESPPVPDPVPGGGVGQGPGGILPGGVPDPGLNGELPGTPPSGLTPPLDVPAP